MEDNAKLPEYEVAHKRITSEARKQVMAKAERLAKEYAERKAGGGKAEEDKEPEGEVEAEKD